jgi:hypothetical protein
MTASICLLLAVSFGQPPPPAAAGRVSGRITAEGANTAIAGARVMLFPAAPRRMGAFTPPGEAITDQDGRFVVERLAAGEYNLNVQKTGYVSFPGTPGRPHTIQVAAGQAVDGVSVVLQKGGAIAGRLLDTAGEPLTDASVMALRNAPVGGSRERYLPTSGPGQQTNDLGEFRLPGLAPGAYIVVASPRRQFPFGGPGAAPPTATASRITEITTYYPGTSDQAAAQTINVSAGQTVENVVFTMLSAPAYRISGVVVDENGSAVGGAMVMLMNDPRSGTLMGPSGSARTQDDGRFVIAAVPAGTYRLTANVPVTVSSGGVASGSGSFTTWTSSGGRGEVAAGVSPGIVGGTSVVMGPGAMPTPTEITVVDADVAGVRLTVRR